MRRTATVDIRQSSYLLRVVALGALAAACALQGSRMAEHSLSHPWGTAHDGQAANWRQRQHVLTGLVRGDLWQTSDARRLGGPGLDQAPELWAAVGC
jgi:hypothetical protein